MNWWKKLTYKTPEVLCRHTALMAATLYNNHYDVRLVSGQTEAGPHMQAKVLIDGNWEWLEASGKVWIGKQQYAFTGDIREFTLQEYLDFLIGKR